MERPRYSQDDERTYLARGYWRDDDTLWHWLRRHASERPAAPAVVSTAGQLTWRELHDRVLRVAQGLHDKGIGAGDVVAVQLPNVPEFLLVHLALARLGAVMCTVHMPYRGAEIEAILAHSGAALFFTSAYPFAELEAREAGLKLTLTRISGAIQVLEELLQENESAAATTETAANAERKAAA